MRQVTRMTTIAGGVAASMLVTITAGCGVTAKTTADTIPVPKVPSTLAVAKAPTASPTTAKPQASLSSQYQAYMVALTKSPAWAIVEAQVAPENTYATNFSGNAPTITDAQLAAVTAEIHNVTAELNALAQNDESKLNSSNTDADGDIQDVAIDMSTIASDASSGEGVPDDINMTHKDDVQVRTLLQLPLSGPGAIAAVPEASS